MRFDDGDELELDKDKESIEMKKTHRTIQDFFMVFKNIYNKILFVP